MNDVIEVSGFFNTSGVLQATRIEKKEDFVANSSEIELKGVVSGLTGTTFSLGSFTVDFTGADLSGVPGGVIANDIEVEVKGTLSGTNITATHIKEEDDLFGDNVDKVSLEGVIANFVNTSSFQVSGQMVDASSALFDPAGLVLRDGIEVEVEGPIVSGVLQAVKVEARDGNVKIDATVSAVDPAAGIISLQFVPGLVTVTVNNQTSLRDDLGILDPLMINNITAGDFLDIRGLIDGSGNVVASEIRRDNTDDDILQGPVESFVPGSSVMLLGVYILYGGWND